MYNGCIEDIILSNLIHNESYTRRVLPFLKMEYFTQPHHRELFKLIALYIEKYNGCPSVAAVAIDLSNSSNVNQEQVEQIGSWLDECKPDNVIAEDYLIDQTEHFCQDKAIYNAIMNSIKIIDGSDKKLDKGSIPALLNEALGVSFDSNVGHDFLENAEDRYEFYHRIEDRISFDLDLLNIITKGGLPKKTLNVILAGCVHPDTLVRVRFKPRNSTLAT